MERVQVRGIAGVYPTRSEPFRAHTLPCLSLFLCSTPGSVSMSLSLQCPTCFLAYDPITPYLCTPSLRSCQIYAPPLWVLGLAMMHDYLYVVPVPSVARARTFVALLPGVCGACFANIVFVVYAVYASSSLSCPWLYTVFAEYLYPYVL